MGTMLSQVNSSCEPVCDPSGDDFDADTDHMKKTVIDVSKDVIMDVKPVVEEALSTQGVMEALAAVVGDDGAEALIDEVLIPCMDSAVADNLINVNAAIEAEMELNPDEKFEVKDKLPATSDVVKAVKE